MTGLYSSLHSQNQVQDLVKMVELSYTELLLSEMNWEAWMSYLFREGDTQVHSSNDVNKQ